MLILIYPTLHSNLVAKSNCYLKEIEITETSAKCNLQSMVDHTTSGILDQPMHKLQSMDSSSYLGIRYLKAGMDGASSQSRARTFGRRTVRRGTVRRKKKC